MGDATDSKSEHMFVSTWVPYLANKTRFNSPGKVVLRARNIAQMMPFRDGKHIHLNKRVTWTEKAIDSKFQHIPLSTMVLLSNTKVCICRLALEVEVERISANMMKLQFSP